MFILVSSYGMYMFFRGYLIYNRNHLQGRLNPRDLLCCCCCINFSLPSYPFCNHLQWYKRQDDRFELYSNRVVFH